MIYRALAMSALNAAGRSVQLFAFILIGRFFGASPETDAIFLYAAPLYVLIAVGAGVGEIVLIPGMRRLNHPDHYRHFRNKVLSALIAASLGAAAATFAVLFMLVDPPSFAACVLLLAMVGFGNLAAFHSAALHARGRHFLAILAPFPGGVAALCVLFLIPQDADGLAATLLSFEVGRSTYLLFAARAGFPKPVTQASAIPELTRLLQNGRYQLLASAAVALNPVVDVFFARPLGEGAVTSLEYAAKLWNAVPLAFSGALILLHVRWTDMHLMDADLTKHARRMALLMGAGAIPVTAVLILVSPWLLALLYGNAEMSSQAITLVVSCLIGYLPGAVPFVASLVLLRVFSAKGNVRSIAVVSLLSLPLNAALNLVLVGPFGLPGLAFATSLVYALNFCGLWLLLDKE